MKKVFAIMAIAAFVVACNNKSDKKAEENKDTTKMENKMDNKMDTDTSKMMPADSTKM